MFLAVPVSALPEGYRAPLRAATDAPEVGAASVCEHPYPCGNGEEWPVGLDGEPEFELKEVLHPRLVSHDGVELEGWIALPKLPEGVRAPVALHSSPYLGACHVLAAGRCVASPDDPEAKWWESDGAHPHAVMAWGVAPFEFVKRGYAAAFFSVRGTGNSGGCFEFFGPNEQKDQAVIVEWLAAQPWSNGRVAMGGLSYPGTTPNQAAIRNPKSLKTIVVTGTNTDFYTSIASPQGAVHTFPTAFNVAFVSSVSVLPPLGLGSRAAEASVDYAAVLPERACPAVVEAATSDAATYLSDVRDADYWGDRRLIDRFGNIKAAVLLAHGFLDNIAHGSVHGFQDSAVWKAAQRAPKRQVVGQWGHRWPNKETPDWVDLPNNAKWEDLLFDWLDYWLKGIGSPDGLGVVDYQDDGGTWRQSDAWPPKEAKEQVLFLGGEKLAGVAGRDSRSYQSVPGPHDSFMAFSARNLPVTLWASLCKPGGTGLAYVGEPLAEDTVVAGNPFAYLRLSADRPGGIVAVHLVELEPGFNCSPAAQAQGLKVLSAGAADLRFHQGNFVGKAFPVGAPTNVRIDLQDLAERVDAGQRLALVVSYGDGLFFEWGGQPYYPRITVHSDGGDLASQVVLPVVSGSLGGGKPRVDYPPRPFVPSK